LPAQQSKLLPGRDRGQRLKQRRLAAPDPAPPISAGEPAPTRTPYWLYLLECQDASLYTGIAIDVIDRFIRHLLGLGAAYTRSHPPRRILACRQYPDKGQALRAEYALKQLPRNRKLDFFLPAEQLDDRGGPEHAPGNAKNFR
jgi:putative endonuclease